MKRFLCTLLTTCMVLSSVTVAYADDTIVPEFSDEVVISEESADELVAEDAIEEVIEETAIEDEMEFIEIEDVIEDEVVDEEIIEEVIEEDPVIEEVIEEEAALDYSEIVEGYQVSVHADNGVFPEGTSVSIRKVSKVEESTVAAQIQAKLDDESAVAKTATFDITFTDVNGNELEPENGKVDVNIGVTNDFEQIVANAVDGEVTSVDVQVYHMDNENGAELVSTIERADEADLSEVSFAADEFSSYTLVIITHKTPDTKAPVIYSISYKNTTYTKVQSTKAPEVILNVDDDLSGVSMVELRYTCKANGQYIKVKPTYNKNDKKWHGKFNIGLAQLVGTYTLTDLVVADKAHNVRSYNSKNLPSKYKKSIIIKNQAKTKFAPKISALQLTPTSITIKDAKNIPITLAIQVTNVGSATGGVYGAMAHFTLTPSNKSDKKEFVIQLANRTSGNPGYAVLYGGGYVNYASITTGTLTLDGVEIANNYGDMVEFTSAAKTFDAKKIKISAVDNKAPVVNSVKFNKSNVNLTGKSTTVKVTASISEDYSGVAKFEGVLSNGKQMITLNDFKKDKGKNTMTTSIVIPDTQASGTYKLTYLYIADNAGNTRAYSTSKKTMTSALKKTQITVVSDCFITIAFDANGGKGTMSSKKNVQSGKAVQLPANKFTRTGYTFNGWNTKADGSGKAYHDEETVKITASSGKTVKLYAQWKGREYTIKFNGNGATSGSMTSQKCGVGVTCALKKNAFKRSGYEFDGWCTQPNGAGEWFDDCEKVKNLRSSGGTITLYAQWIKWD